MEVGSSSPIRKGTGRGVRGEDGEDCLMEQTRGDRLTDTAKGREVPKVTWGSCSE